MKCLSAGKIDLTLTTERTSGRYAERLLQDRLVWVGARGGEAFQRIPLPVSHGSGTCAFRPAVIEALTNDGRDWRIVCQNNYLEPVIATVEADLAITSLLISTVPDSLQIFPDEAPLPPLPKFYVNMYLPRSGVSDIAKEMARHIRVEFAARYPTLRVTEALVT